MTISTQTIRNDYTGNGVTTVFAYTFPIFTQSDLKVQVVATDNAVTLLTLTTDYTVSGVGLEAGGSVTLVNAPLPSGYRIVIASDIPNTQPTDYKNQGSFYPITHERSFDRSVRLVQQLNAIGESSLRLSDTAPLGISTVLPLPESSALLGWDTGAISVRNYSLSELAISIAYGNKQFQTENGDGIETEFALIKDPGSLGNLDISIDGVTQVPGVDYTYSGVTLTFADAPEDEAVILIRFDDALPTGVTTAESVNYKLPATGSVQRKISDKADDIRSIVDFGAKGDGITDCTAAILAARNWAAARSYAGNTVKLIWPAGRYVYTSSPNWAIIRLHLSFEGEVWLINTGTGSSFVLDGGAAGAGVYGMRITGYPQIYGGSTTMHGVYARAIHRSHIEYNVRGAGSAYSGFYGEWCVSNTIFPIANVNEGGYLNEPARAMTLTIRGAAEECSYNNFYNVEASGLTTGLYLDGALGNVFHGGAVQANTTGVTLTSNAWNNKFVGVDFEANTTDVSDGSRETQYYGCDFEVGPTFTATAVNCSMFGGVTEDITIASGALRTLLSGVAYNRFGSGSISDAGTQTRYRDLRNKAIGVVENVARARTALTVSASPFSYTNNTGNEETIIVSGGVVSQIELTRFAGDPIGLTSGMFTLSPADAITITYSSTPNVVKWTR